MSNHIKIAKNLKRFKKAVEDHDKWNPDHSSAYGIAVSKFDLERLDFDEGEELWAGVTIHSDNKCSGNFRILCDCENDHSGEIPAEEQITEAVGTFVEAAA